MEKLPAFLRVSSTDDGDSPMACHAALAKRLNFDIPFADPYAPWKRGSEQTMAIRFSGPTACRASSRPTAPTRRRSVKPN